MSEPVRPKRFRVGHGHGINMDGLAVLVFLEINTNSGSQAYSLLPEEAKQIAEALLDSAEKALNP